MTHHDTLLKIKEQVAPHLESAGYVFVDMRLYRNQAGAQVLEVLADRPEGGITLGECAALSRQIGGLLEQENILTGRTVLSVSSPGTDRPLRTFEDFRRVKGRTVRVFLSQPVSGKIEHCGVLEEAAGEVIRLILADKTIEIPYDKINKAKQVV
jgi:ribosome maturation factor RimP